MNNKDIYDLLNEIEFDISDEKEIILNDIDKKKIKNNVKSNINKKRPYKKMGIVAAVASLVFVTIIFTPVGENVLAKMKEIFFFNPGTGATITDDNIYVLPKPINLKEGNLDVSIKSIVSNKDNISITIWINGEGNTEFQLEEMKDNIKLSTDNQGELTGNIISIAGGGKNTFVQIDYTSNELVKNFNLLLYDKLVEDIELIEVDGKEALSSIGGNAISNDLLVGGNKYVLDGKTYISLWTEEEFKSNGAFYSGFPIENVKFTNEDGKEYDVSYSDNSGNLKEFVINEEIDGNVKVNIESVELEYSLKNPVEIDIDIPDSGEMLEINKEVKFEELNESLFLSQVKNTGKGVELHLDSNKYKKEDSSIVIVSLDRAGWGIGSSDEEGKIILGIDKEDYTIKEKITGKIETKISKVNIRKNGEWKFDIN